MGQWKRLECAPAETLYPVLDSLNQLGEVPWLINKPILDLQIQIFRNGGNKKLDIAPPSSKLDTSQFAGGADAAAAFKRRVAINRARAEMHSLWCDALYKLSLANHYRDSIFWLPHNLDFRGRVYACGPHVSALGADAQRALLTFARKQPLGPRGLRWLKLHAINLTGTMKKSTVDERLAYADSIMDKILDSADRPLEGSRWWAESEEPWQTLACCMEIANAVRSPNPEEYMCGFPVHQDGSCNGLQHYAALGGDAAGAAAVNLAPLDRPQDVYSAVAAMVEEMRIRDAAAGVPAALILENFVRRKVIKQTVMTTVYGVTKFGARLQIAKQLKDIDEFPKEHVWTCSQYLTTKTFDSLREMFTSTKLIQDWFTDCAKLISAVCGESVEWVTPLGLPVVQPYYRRAGVTTGQYRPALDQHQRPCTMKQRNAFPPNFIHSLDSSHMMLTGLHCEAGGVTFVSVHDCFWTHPRSVDTMNKNNFIHSLDSSHMMLTGLHCEAGGVTFVSVHDCFWTHPRSVDTMNKNNFIHSLDSSHMMLTGLHCEAGGVTFVSVHDCFWTHPRSVDTMNKNNFIHSLDSSHMMLTGLHCEAGGVTFVSVHDCFWTHPRSVDTMNKLQQLHPLAGLVAHDADGAALRGGRRHLRVRARLLLDAPALRRHHEQGASSNSYNNFIHSLDSSHMMLTGLHCEAGGVTFVSVHDCFWTHPRSVDTMNKNNFIHSLDSSHMMLTGLHCEAGGVTFVSVHDCFWTHPRSVDTMNKNNFIHSLDSSHMMLTGLHCEAGGVTFVSVHDCFWTHPRSVDTMNKNNFIHSLDSSHMMLTGLHCEAGGVTFVSVHDCFWTHPRSVDTMNKNNFIHSLDSSHMMLTGLHCEAGGVTFVSVHDCFWTHPRSVDTMNKNNFIHSLDSSHMMLTGLHCEAGGVTFVSVHDCFWTHPRSVDTMNKICREQFVALHSQPILEDLSEFLTKRYSYAESELEDRSVGAANKKRVNNLLQKVPSKGDFDLNSVLRSVYFFS
ncbi:hypothetical protein PYW07_005317 [Mythimna separata]|uniref:DNA-directed RNA polymerase n=1 Tax=Mythimna separata TaxID=271217 RepID=A0AAD8DNM4_MYTSE|nr:hypothetical protein PYW07_005317 [Mythimna separata]